MTDDKRFDALMKLADYRFARWQNRRSYEWKISIGLWAILAAAVIYLKPSGFAPLMITLVILVAVVAGHAWLWVKPNWISNEMDIRTAFHFAEHAEGILLTTAPQPEKRLDWKEFKKSHGGFKFLHEGICQFQIFATGLLALGFFLLRTIGAPN